jgi:predicted MFS family arabinose efflux permease
VLADVKQISSLLSDGTLLRLNWGIFALHFALMAAFVAVPMIISTELSIKDSELPLVYLALLGGGFFIMLPIMILGEKYKLQRLTFLGAVAVMAGATLFLGFERNPLSTPLLLLLFFTAFNLLEATLPSWLSKSSPAGNRGTAMGIYSTSQFLGSFAGGVLGGWSLQEIGIDGLFIVISLVLFVWWVLSLGLQSPKPLQTLVLSVGDREHQDFLKIISKIAGVEDILLIKGEQLAYVQIDRLLIDMPSLQPYLNR